MSYNGIFGINARTLRGASVASLLVGAVLVATVFSWSAGETHSAEAKRAAKKPAAQSVEMFSGIKNGDISVKLIPTDSRSANVIIQNHTKRPLSVQLPEAFAGVPILAQFGNNNNNNSNNNNNQNQAMGMGGGMMGGMGGGMMGGGMGGMMNIAPEKTTRFKLAGVCLEHGKPDPSPRVPYEVKPLEEVTSDPNVKQVLKILGTGKVNQRIAQAAAWHFANGMSWEELAAKKIDRLGRPDEPFYSPQELRAAMKVSMIAEQMAQREAFEKPTKPADDKPTKSRSEIEKERAAAKAE